MTGSLVVGQRFKTVEDFEAALAAYQKEQHVPYTVTGSTSVDYYNKRQEEKGLSKKLNKNLRWKDAVFGCKHYGAARRHQHVEGRKSRPNQSTFKLGCQAKVNIYADVNTQEIIVSKIQEEHSNHPIDEDFEAMYPEFRRPDKETVEAAEKLISYEVKPHLIRETVRATGVKATRQDIANIRNRWKQKFKGNQKEGKKEGEMKATYEVLEGFLKEDPEGTVALTYNEESLEIQTVLIQTSQMKKVFNEYPEVLVLDTTYKLSSNNMPLVVFQVIDRYGSGRVIGYALISSEKKEVLCEALSILKKGCPEAFAKIKTVVVDKDQSEIGALKIVIPHADVHLCDFHVKNAMRRRGVKEPNWDALEPVLDKLIHAFSEEDYNKAYEELQLIASEGFMVYFDKNWHSIKEVWVLFKRNLSFNLGERTTGRVESHNDKIKKVIERKLPVSEVLFRLWMLHKDTCRDAEYKDFVSLVKLKYDKYSKDPVIQKIRKCNTPFVGQLIRPQYERSLEPPSTTPHVVTLVSCDCGFFNNYKLPCAHIFRYRRENGVEIFDPVLIPERWALISEKPISADIDVGGTSSIGIVVPDSGPRPRRIPKQRKEKTVEEKYKFVEAIGQRLATIVCDNGGSQFQSRVNALLALERLWKNKFEAAVLGMNPDGSLCKDSIVVDGSNGSAQNANQLEPAEKVVTIDDTREDIVQLQLNQVMNEDGRENVVDDTETNELLTLDNETISNLLADFEDLEDKEKNDNDLVQKSPSQLPSRNQSDVETSKDDDTEGTAHGFDLINLPPDLKNLLHLPSSPLVRGRPKGNRNSKKKKHVSAKKNSQSMEIVCCSCGLEAGDHVCQKCTRRVHAIPPCSTPAPESEEGYGQMRICQFCQNKDNDKPSVSPLPPSYQKITCGSCKQEAGKRTSFSKKNKGRKFFCCPAPQSKECQSFIQWVDDIVNADPDENIEDIDSSSDAEDEAIADTNPAPSTKTYFCFSCGLEAAERTSASSKNPGRRYICCPNPSSEKCKKFFCWLSSKNSLQFKDPPPSARKTNIASVTNNNEQCLMCNEKKGENHFCLCIVCKQPVGDSDVCSSCLRRFHHPGCGEQHGNDNMQPVCSNCLKNKEISMCQEAFDEISTGKWLTDPHFVRMNNFLANLFHDLQGLKTPYVGSSIVYSDENGEQKEATDVTEPIYYSIRDAKQDYIQVINTGHEHWVVCIIPKGKAETVWILDSSQGKRLSCFMQSQIAMMLHTSEEEIKVSFPNCQVQQNGHDCGLFAIANAVQFAFTRRIECWSFDASRLRSHWKQCILANSITEFPKSKELIIKKILRSDIIQVYCVCRMPEHYGESNEMVACSSCSAFFHFACVQFDGSRRFKCRVCLSSLTKK